MAENELFNRELLNNKKVKIHSVKGRLKIFLTQSEEFMSLTLFFKDGHYDDSQILIAKDQNALKWAKNLKKYY
jgi:predicted transcriptional regulator